MRLSPSTVADQFEWIHTRHEIVVPLVNEVRAGLGEAFATEVDPISTEGYHAAIDAVGSEGDLAVNVAALVAILRELDVEGDYPGFVVDELLGRELAAMVAGTQPRRLLAEATFHYADVHHHTDGPAGADDLDAALAAGVQTRLPGWDWTETESPFDIERPSGQ
ncbi:hypothetical protein [Halalkalicoccus jeotgali]|uniref:DUF7984 domain-containing protein n=1 Tax=Halalkalicoccus jeotgali (strain DSM 18796 / CECT 7217 / JCM 14584 / KCTC 4019 / B3) TaxID=795797 RepID=D8J7U1_HALJB|nr:hypothetical protein [Halalkalicoccus jeotgali]ADJ16111.1 hypothetical protein HacjB3_13650 [Halalkalicoccus jeotgali B3]ELY38206.1 hypothetical protein C497_08859 [Halalkalicoccus jeotgali B3]